MGKVPEESEYILWEEIDPKRTMKLWVKATHLNAGVKGSTTMAWECYKKVVDWEDLHGLRFKLGQKTQEIILFFKMLH